MPVAHLEILPQSVDVARGKRNRDLNELLGVNEAGEGDRENHGASTLTDDLKRRNGKHSSINGTYS